MKVYLCTVGERGEGYGVRKIYRNESRALNWLTTQRDEIILDDVHASPIETVCPGHTQFRVACDIYAVRTVEVE